MFDSKFRGYDKDSHVWRYGYYYFYTDTIYCVASDKEHEENEHHCILFDGFCDWDMPRPHYKSFVEKDTVGQSIGILDIKGMEIFTGDIVRCNSAQMQGDIQLDKDNARFVCNDMHDGIQSLEGLCDDLEVVGNIYDL